MSEAPSEPLRIGGRYALGAELSSGGMATVHLGRLRGPVGFARTVAIKRLYPTYARDDGFVAMFVDEARLAARVRHPNVVATLDVVVDGGELFLVMEHVLGVTLAELTRLARARGKRLPPALAAGIVAGALDGLHAAHEATNEHGEPLGLVHRDVSPENVLVGADGVARVLDFGFARAAGRLHVSTEGILKGKVAYMAPEQISADVTSRRSDVYAAGVVLWEALVGRRLFEGETVGGIVGQMLLGDVAPPSRAAPDVPKALDAVVLRALSPVPEARFATAKEMVLALEQVIAIATPREIAAWLRDVAEDELEARAALVARVERETATTLPDAAELASAKSAKNPGKTAEIEGAPERAPGTPGLASEPTPVVAALPLARERAAEARRFRLAWPLALGLVAVALAALWTFRGASDAPPLASASAPIASLAAPSAPVAAAPPAASAPPAPAASGPVASAPPVASLAASAPLASPPRASAPRPAAPPRPRVSCDPPYVVDADGIRVPKPECL